MAYLTFSRKRAMKETVVCTACLMAMLAAGCETESTSVNESVAAYRDRILARHAEPVTLPDDAKHNTPVVQPVAAQGALPTKKALLSEPAVDEPPDPAAVLAELPDPVDAAAVFNARVERLRDEHANRQDQRVVRNYERVVETAIEYLQRIQRPRQVRLSLAECVQRALNHNYAIRIEAHNPAITQTQIAEAEAAFDVEFFLDTSWSKLDQATAQAFNPATSDTRSIQGGFRKLLPSGMQTSVSLSQSRSQNNLPAEFQSLNPAYNTSLVAQLRQPLLRNFGLDVNRAQINVRKIEHDISIETFQQRVRDTLLDVENAYWQLVSIRRSSAILAESVAQNYITYRNMVERLEHDATQVEVANSKSRWESRMVEYYESVKQVRDAEDRLKNLLNDPEILLSADIEIVPTETPLVAPIVLDHFSEVRTALDQRSEIRQARLQIESARINTMVAKNQTLPQLDLTFQYEMQGIGDTGDNSFDNLTTNRFISYTVGANFSYNFGERAGRAAWRRARLQESQAIVALNQATDAIVEEVNNAIRTLLVRFEQVPPQLSSVQSAERNLRALQARTQRIDPNYLQTELSAVEQLANNRNTLLGVVVGYNTGLIQLEKAKGTLLDYNNVVVTDAQRDR